MSQMKLSVLILCGLLAGCGGSLPTIQFESNKVAVKPFHPPLPPPVSPVYPKPKVMTPGVTREMNAEVDEGLRPPYVYIGFDDQTWLTLGQYNAEMRAYIKHLRAVIKWYGHPELQDPKPTEEKEVETP